MAERRVGIDKDKQYKRQDSWVRENKDRLQIYLPKGLKDELKAKAAAEGKSLNEWIIERVSRD